MAEKRTLSRRHFLHLSAVGAAGVMAAACAMPTTGTETGGEMAEAPMEEPVELRLSHWWGELITPSIPLIEEKHNVSITEESATWGEYFDKLLTQFAGDVAPDVMMTSILKVGPFYTAGLLQPLAPAMERNDIDPALWALDLNSLAFKGDIFGLPMFLNFPLGFAVNLDLIEAEGFDVPHPWPFWGTEDFDNFSYEQLTENFEACTKRSATGEVEIYGSATTWGSINQQSLFENGGDFFDSYDFDETECLLNSPEVVEAVKAYTDWVIDYEVSPSLGATQAFKEGVWRAQKGVVQYSWLCYNCFQSPEATGFNWRMFHLPQLPSFKARRNLIMADMVTANPSSEHADLAADIAVTFTTDWDFTQKLYLTWLNLPAYNSGAHLSLVEDDPHIVEAMKVYLSRYAAFSEDESSTEGFALAPGTRGRHAGFVDNTVTTEIEAVLVGDKTAQQAMDDAKALVDAQLAKS